MMRASTIVLTAMAIAAHASSEPCSSEDIMKRCNDFSANAITSCSPDDFICQHIQLKAINAYCQSICDTKIIKNDAPISLEDTWRVRISDLASEDTNMASSSFIRSQHKRDISGPEELTVTASELIQGLTLKQISEFNGGPHGVSNSMEDTLRPVMADFYSSGGQLKKRRTYAGIGSTFQLHLKDPRTGEIVGTHELLQDDDEKTGHKELPSARYKGAFIDVGDNLSGTRLYWDDDEDDEDNEIEPNSSNTSLDYNSDLVNIGRVDLDQLGNVSEDVVLTPSSPPDQIIALAKELLTPHSTSQSSAPSVTLYLDKSTSTSSTLLTATPISITNSSEIVGSIPSVVNRIKKKLNINAVYSNTTNSAVPSSRYRKNSTSSQSPRKHVHNGATRPASSLAAAIVAIAFIFQ